MTYKNKMLLSGLTLLFGALVLVPSVSFAQDRKNDDHNDDRRNNNTQMVKMQAVANFIHRDDNNDQERNNFDRPCWQAIGHLFAPGWFNRASSSNNSIADCSLPFGLLQRFFRSTTTPDANSPVISGIVINPSTTEAVIGWNTNELTKATVYYSTTSPVDLSTNNHSQISLTSYTFGHHVSLKNLVATTTYYVVIVATDLAGNVTTSNQQVFTTLGSPTDTLPPTISQVLVTVSSSTLKVMWQTDELATSKVYYSTTSPVNLTDPNTLSVTSSSSTLNHSLEIGNLTAGTRYNFVIESVDQSGNKRTSSQFSVQTTF